MLREFVFETASRSVQLLWIGLIVFAIEHLSRRYPLKAERQLRGLTYALVVVPISVAISWGLYGLAEAMHLKPPIHLRDLPWLGGHPLMLAVASVALSIAVSDFFYYWTHRAQHALPFLWRFHALHHSIEDLSALNNYSHWSEEAVQIIFKVIPAALLLGTDMNFLAPLAASLIILHQAYIHSASELNFGRWAWLINDNRRHRVHHSLEARHFDKNFGINLGLWDRLFGTAYAPAADEWPQTGLADRPEPVTLKRFLVWS